MKNYKFKILIVSLVLILCLSIFYMVFVHVPYYSYYHDLDLVRNEIVEKNKYQYDNYFHEHHGKQLYYIIKVKVNNEEYYVAYDENKKFVDSLKAPFASQKEVINAINKKYKASIDSVDVGYENNRFVYCQKIMTSKKLTYVYYRVDNGEFLKAYFIED